MSIWRITREDSRAHVADADLAALVLAGPDAAAPRTLAHLTSCPPCAEGLGTLEARLDEDRRVATAAADRAFPADRLDRQRAAILRRLGYGRHLARILPFPSTAPPVVSMLRRQVVHRWVAAAALAGLIVGAVAGRLLETPRRPAPSRAVANTHATPDTALAPQQLQASALAEEAFFRDFEAAAIDGPHVEPLRALDALTPHPADARLPR